MRRKEDRDAADQPHAVDARCEGSVGGNEQEQHGCHPCRRITGGFRARFAQNQGVPDDLQHLVEGEQVEDIEGEQQGAHTFAGSDIGEERKRAIEQPLLCGRKRRSLVHWTPLLPRDDVLRAISSCRDC
jgi:hypothetical protein